MFATNATSAVPVTTVINGQSKGPAITANVIEGRWIIGAASYTVLVVKSRPVVHATGRGAHHLIATVQHDYAHMVVACT